MNLSPQQLAELLRRLAIDYEFKETDSYFYCGVCPNCRKKELYVSKEAPWRVSCNRLNKCGFSASTYELYKNTLFAEWSAHYPPTATNPNATADAYMESARSLPLGLVSGLYRQEYYIGRADNQRTATVRFTLSDGKAQWERLIDNPDNFPGKKGRAFGSYKGLWWQRSDEDFSKAKTIYIVEGIFDALSLIAAGHVAVASISSKHYPDGFFAMLKAKHLKPHIIFALDNDHAGRDGIKKHVIKVRQAGFWVSAALPPKGKDWNDLWASKRLDSLALEEARYQGDLLLAKSANEVARIMYRKSCITTFALTHASRTYWFELDMAAYQQVVANKEAEGTWNELDESCIDEVIKEAGNLKEIANCTVTPLYYQSDRYTDDAHYFVRISRPQAADVMNTFTGAQLGGASDFKKRLLSICPGALYEGNGKQLNRIIKTTFNRLPTVEKIDYTGYVPELDAWIFQDFGICKGKVIKANQEQFIALNGSHSIKTVCDIRIQLNTDTPDLVWLPHLLGAFGERGLVALAFFTGTLFVNQLRQQQQSYPFLEITGDAGTGKTTLLEFLWRLHGRADYEGFDPNKASFIGRSRGFNKVSGLPVVLIEGDHHTGHFKKFDFEELKDLFNGRAVYTRAVRTAGLETYDPPFRGSIIVAQNARMSASEAIMSRTIPLYFMREDIRFEGKAHVDALNRFDRHALSAYLSYMLKNCKKLLDEYFALCPANEQRLLNHQGIAMSRIAQNGAQMMTLLQVLAKHINLSDEWLTKTLAFIEQICVMRQQSLNAEDPRLVEFWDSVEYLCSLNDSFNLNHSADPQLMAISLPHFESCAKQVGVTVLPRIELNALLEKGRRYQFQGRKVVRSVIFKKSVKCLVFKKGEAS